MLWKFRGVGLRICARDRAALRSNELRANDAGLTGEQMLGKGRVVVLEHEAGGFAVHRWAPATHCWRRLRARARRDMTVPTDTQAISEISL